MTWEDFTARLEEIYWPSLAPEARERSRPARDGEAAGTVPDDIWQAAITIFPDPEGWLHNPVPQLKSKTPLEVLAQGRADEVRGIIMGVADFFLPDPDEVVPWAELEAAERDELEAAQRAEREGGSGEAG
jgi:hypothetical protein